MAPMTMQRTDGSWLDRHVREWVGAGLISESQAESIRRFERLDQPVAPPRLTVVAEVASYLGSVIAFAGGAAIIGPNWEALGLAGQGAVALSIAAVGFVVGAWLVRLGEAGTLRLGSFLWAVGTGGVALAVAAVVNEVDPSDGAWYGVAIGVPVLAIGAAMWRNLDRPLQLLTGGVGFVIAGGGLTELTHVPVAIAAVVLWVVSFAFGLLAARDVVQPRLTALAMGAVGLMTGSFMFGDESERVAAVIAVMSAAMIVAFALHDRSWPLVAIGLVAFFIATTSMMATVLQGTGARTIAVVLGLAVVAYVAIRAQRMGPAGPSG